MALTLAGAGAAAFALISVSAGWVTLGIALTAGMALSALRRSRIGTSVPALVTGLGPWWDGFIIFGALYIALAFWLVRAGRQGLDD